MKNYLLYEIVKRLSIILSKKDFGVIVLHLFKSVLDNAIVEGTGAEKRFMVNGSSRDLEHARAICQVCIYHGFYMETFVSITEKIGGQRPSRFSIYTLLREELALAKEKTREHSLPMLRCSLYKEDKN